MTGNGDEMMQSMSLLDKGASFERQQLLFEQHGRAHGLLRSPSGSCVWVKAVLKYQEMMMCKCCRLHILSFSSSSFLLYWCSTLHCFPLLLRGRGRRCVSGRVGGARRGGSGAGGAPTQSSKLN